MPREFIENMPLNGRSFQALIALTPGNVTAKTYYTASGQFSIDGQRTDANYFSIDGVSANVGITQGSNVYLGSAGAGSSPATSNNGGYNNLVSVDDMQEYKIQTNSFDAEYGRTRRCATLHRHPQRHQSDSWHCLRIRAQRHLRRQYLVQQQRGGCLALQKNKMILAASLGGSRTA